MTPIDSYIYMLSPQLRSFQGRVRRHGLAGGGVSLGAGFEVLKAHTWPSVFLSVSAVRGPHCKTHSYFSSTMPTCL